MFNINTFKQTGLVYGGARPALFKVMLYLPSQLQVDNLSVTKFTFVCKSASLPASSVGSIDVSYFGRKIKVAGDRNFNDWRVSVLNDEDFSVRAMFESWSNAINRLVANVRDANLDMENYKADMEVVQYGKDGEAVRSYRIVGAFPTDIGEIGLNWDQQNSVEEFDVSFAFDWFEPEIETSSKKAGGVNAYKDQAWVDGPEGDQ